MPDAEPTALALLPAGLPLALLAPLGDLLDAALGGGAQLATADRGGIAAKVLLPHEQSVTEAADRLRAATAAIRGVPYERPDHLPEEDDGLAMGHMREHPDGGLSFGIGGPAARDLADQAATNLLEHMLPALDARGAVNYLEWNWEAPDTRHDGLRGTGRKFSVIVCRPDGKTPHQLRQEADEARGRALEALGRLDMALWEHLGWLADEEPVIERGEGQREQLLARAAARSRAGQEAPVVPGACASGTCRCDQLGETADG